MTEDDVRDLVELACYVPSAKNLQPLKYISVSKPATVASNSSSSSIRIGFRFFISSFIIKYFISSFVVKYLIK